MERLRDLYRVALSSIHIIHCHLPKMQAKINTSKHISLVSSRDRAVRLDGRHASPVSRFEFTDGLSLPMV